MKIRYKLSNCHIKHRITCFSHGDSEKQRLVKPAHQEAADVQETAPSVPTDEPLIGPTAELHSSFSDELSTGSHQLDVDPTVLNHRNVDAA